MDSASDSAWETCHTSDPEINESLRQSHRESQQMGGKWYRACRLAGIETAMDVFGRVRASP